jgi:hypothetical protein
MDEANLNEGIRLTYELDERLLSNELLKVVSRDSSINFQQTIPCWKGDLMRKMMEHVSRAEIVHFILRN